MMNGLWTLCIFASYVCPPRVNLAPLLSSSLAGSKITILGPLRNNFDMVDWTELRKMDETICNTIYEMQIEFFIFTCNIYLCLGRKNLFPSEGPAEQRAVATQSYSHCARPKCRGATDKGGAGGGVLKASFFLRLRRENEKHATHSSTQSQHHVSSSTKHAA
jgi:hypothetical protein